jgi:hypothetical protein
MLPIRDAYSSYLTATRRARFCIEPASRRSSRNVSPRRGASTCSGDQLPC